MDDSVIQDYLASKGEKSNKTKLNRIREGTAYFAGKGITSPSESDYEEWRKHLEATKPGHRKGTLMGPKTSGDWRDAVKGFYEWLNGSRQLMFPAMQSGLEETNDKEDMIVVENVDVESERVVEGELAAESTQSAEELEVSGQEPCVSTEERDSDTLSPVATNAFIDAPTVKPKGKGGRKVLDPHGEKRSEKVMLYLRPSLMTDVKDLASLAGKSVADYVISLVERETEAKQQKLALFRELRDSE